MTIHFHNGNVARGLTSQIHPLQNLRLPFELDRGHLPGSLSPVQVGARWLCCSLYTCAQLWSPVNSAKELTTTTLCNESPLLLLVPRFRLSIWTSIYSLTVNALQRDNSQRLLEKAADPAPFP
jgi:hypothetical protein